MGFTGLQDYRGLLTKGDVITGGINEKGSYLTNTFSIGLKIGSASDCAEPSVSSQLLVSSNCPQWALKSVKDPLNNSSPNIERGAFIWLKTSCDRKCQQKQALLNLQDRLKRLPVSSGLLGILTNVLLVRIPTFRWLVEFAEQAEYWDGF